MTGPTTPSRKARVLALIERIQGLAKGSLLDQVWQRMLQVEFVDRSVALAGKAFVCLFPLLIVVSAFIPDRLRRSLSRAVSSRLGLAGPGLETARRALNSPEAVRQATGLLGLLLTVFFAMSFTFALQRVYASAWGRPRVRGVVRLTRGPVWLAGFFGFALLMGGASQALAGGPRSVLYAGVALLASALLWSGTAWLMLEGRVRFRALLAPGTLTGVALSVYAAAASVWMPRTVANQETQFGFFGVALALVTWFTGAAFIVVVGACTGPVFADNQGWLGRWVRGPSGSVWRTPPDPAPSATSD